MGEGLQAIRLGLTEVGDAYVASRIGLQRQWRVERIDTTKGVPGSTLAARGTHGYNTSGGRVVTVIASKGVCLVPVAPVWSCLGPSFTGLKPGWGAWVPSE